MFFPKKLNWYYTGSCLDMNRRLYGHNIGHSKYTSTGISRTLTYQQKFAKPLEAKKREMTIKKRNPENISKS
jgi:putative endonuclease